MRRGSTNPISRISGYYETGDAGYKDEDGYLYIMARTDDVINVAGAAVYRRDGGRFGLPPDVAECAVIGVADDLKGKCRLGFVPQQRGQQSGRRYRLECVKLVRDKIGPVAAFKLCRCGGSPAQNPLGQSPARHDGKNRQWRKLQDARHD